MTLYSLHAFLQTGCDFSRKLFELFLGKTHQLFPKSEICESDRPRLEDMMFLKCFDQILGEMIFSLQSCDR